MIYPCPRCGGPWTIFNPEEFHSDPVVCKKCWKEIKPEFYRKAREIMMQFSGSQKYEALAELSSHLQEKT